MKKVLGITLLFIAMAACSHKARSCDIKNVILDESFFPGDVSSDPLLMPIPDSPPDSAIRVFYIESNSSIDVVQQYVMNFRLAYLASNFFNEREKQNFNSDEKENPWKMPNGVQALDQNADQSHVGCGLLHGSMTCRWIARYNQYYLFLRSDISETGMTEEEFLETITEIDSRMMQCLDD